MAAAELAVTIRIVNLHYTNRCDVYVGRGSPWGNPYTHIKLEGTLAEFQVPTRHDAIARYEEYLLASPALLARLPELRGRVLGCWCWPLRCHAEVLVRYANTG